MAFPGREGPLALNKHGLQKKTNRTSSSKRIPPSSRRNQPSKLPRSNASWKLQKLSSATEQFPPGQDTQHLVHDGVVYRKMLEDKTRRVALADHYVQKCTKNVFLVKSLPRPKLAIPDLLNSVCVYVTDPGLTHIMTLHQPKFIVRRHKALSLPHSVITMVATW